MTNARERPLMLASISKSSQTVGKRSTPNVPDVNQNSKLGNVNSTDVWTIFPNVSKSRLRSPKRSQMWQLIEPKCYEGGHCQSVLRYHRFFYIHPLMSGRWHRHLMWSFEPQENTPPCAWWGNPLTPYKHCHTGSVHPGRTEVIDLLNSTRQQVQAVTHPSTNRGQCCLTRRIWLPPYVPCQVTTDLATLHENTSWVITFITCHILLINAIYIAHAALNAYL